MANSCGGELYVGVYNGVRLDGIISHKLNRRNFLKVSAIGALASVAHPVWSIGSTNEQQGVKNRTQKIAVIGAGLAGLGAAYELDKWGYEVVVLEARWNQVGVLPARFRRSLKSREARSLM